MMWRHKVVRDDTMWNRTHKRISSFSERWWDRGRPLRYCYLYQINEEIKQNQDTSFDDIRLDGHDFLEWLDNNARSHVKVSLDYTDHISTAIMMNMKNGSFTRRINIKVVFSDKKLALLWKLTWGGKMVDRRMIGAILRA